MKPKFFLAWSLAMFGLMPPAFAAELPPLDARLSYTSVLVTRAGVTEERRYQEILIRRPGNVWRARVLPKAHEHDEHAAEGHKHFDYQAATFWLSGTPAQQTLRFVDDYDKLVVTVPAAEYETVGYDGRYVDTATLIDPARVEQMPLSPRPSAVKGAVWHEESRDGWFNRVLWSQARQMALTVESGRADGSLIRRTEAELLPATRDSALPWTALGAYEQKVYDDFVD